MEGKKGINGKEEKGNWLQLGRKGRRNMVVGKENLEGWGNV